MQAELFHPEELNAADIAAWRAMCAATPAFRNPLLSPDFAQLVGEVRDDARVAVFRDSTGGPRGFLAFHRRPSGFARPIGSAFSDYHALITWPDGALPGDEALAAAQISAYRATALLDPHGVFPMTCAASEVGYIIEPGASAEAYLNGLKAANAKRYKNLRRLRTKLEREHGELTVTAGDPSQAAFDQLIAWKRDQYHRTGAHDVCRPDWAKGLLQRAFDRRSEGALRGRMITLRAGGKLVAGLFGPELDGWWHGWVSAFDPAACACGPGLVLMLELPAAMHELGLETCDMSPSHDHYKAPFATRNVAVAEGLSLARSPKGRRQGSLDAAWTLAGSNRHEALARLRRRLDHIAAAELSVGGRVLGVVEALVGFGKRKAFRKVVEDTSARDAA